MARATQNEGAKINSNINVTPMVDVMLVLLIIFMVITPMITPGRPVEMAQAVNPIQMPDADKEDSLIVAIQRDGKIFLGSQQTDPEQLTQKVKEHMQSHASGPLFIKADARAHYRAVAQVVDDVRSAGVGDLGLLTEQKRQ